jgi:hypothetical protein
MAMSKLNIEEKFLLDCIRSNSRNELNIVVENFFDSDHKVDWSVFVQEGFKVFLPIYLEAMRLFKNLRIPKAISEEIKIKYITAVEKNEKIKEAVIELAKECNDAKVNLIYFKGSSLLFTIYQEEVALRPMGDIDCLVNKNDLPKAESILKKMGYRENYKSLSRIPGMLTSRDLFSKRHRHYMYFKDTIVLEIHWDLYLPDDYHPDILKKIFESSDKVRVKNTEINIFSPAASIFIACQRFNGHFPGVNPGFLNIIKRERDVFVYNAFFSFYEIKKMIRHYAEKILWQDFLFFANDVKDKYEVLTLLFLIQMISRADIPESVIKKIRQDSLGNLCVSLCENIDYDNFMKLFRIRCSTPSIYNKFPGLAKLMK